GVDLDPAAGLRVGLDGPGVGAGLVPAEGVAADHVHAAGDRAEHLDELGGLLGGEAHGRVGGRGVGLVGEGRVGDPDAFLLVEVRVGDEVAGVRLGPLWSERAAALVVAVVLHVAGGAPGVGVEAFDPVPPGLSGDPDLAVVVAVPDVLRRRVRAAGVLGLVGDHVVVRAAGRGGADAQAQDAESRPLARVEPEVEDLAPLPGRERFEQFVAAERL